jgi:hypothetical protein
MSARLSRIDADVSSNFKRLIIPTHRAIADGFDNAAKLVSKDQWAFDRRVADAAIEISMEVASAYADSLIAQEHLAWPGLAGMRELLQSHIGRTVKSNCAHGLNGSLHLRRVRFSGPVISVRTEVTGPLKQTLRSLLESPEQ